MPAESLNPGCLAVLAMSLFWVITMNSAKEISESELVSCVMNSFTRAWLEGLAVSGSGVSGCRGSHKRVVARVVAAGMDRPGAATKVGRSLQVVQKKVGLLEGACPHLEVGFAKAAKEDLHALIHINRPPLILVVHHELTARIEAVVSAQSSRMRAFGRAMQVRGR